MGTVADKLSYLNDTKTAIKEAIVAKGVEVADTDTFRSYATKIESIKTGAASGVALESTMDDDGNLTSCTPSNLIINATDISAKALYQTWSNTTSNPPTFTSVSFPNLTTVSGSQALYETFSNNTQITSVSFPSLTSVTGYRAFWHTFNACNAITSMDFPELTTVNGEDAMRGIVQYCEGLTSLTFPKLTTIAGSHAMYGIHYINSQAKLSSLDFPSLQGSLYNCALGANPYITKIWIPSTVTKIVAATSPSATSFSAAYSPFYNCKSSLTIYTDAASKLEGWSDYCFNVSSSATATVVYGATHEDFENA